MLILFYCHELQSGNFEKLNKSVRFPEVLDMAPYMSRTSDRSPLYSLYAVVVHLDIMNAAFSGHYVCYVKNIQGEWFRIDDSTVSSLFLTHENNCFLGLRFLFCFLHHASTICSRQKVYKDFNWWFLFLF